MKSFILLSILLFVSIYSFGQTWSHNFETAGGYTISSAECTDNSYDYFIRTNGSNILDDPTGQEGSYYFAANDIDGCGVASATKELLFDNISITGCTGLSLQVLAASFNGNSTTDNWDDLDFVHIQYSIDNSGTWGNLIWFEAEGGTSASNTPVRIDSDFNNFGDGTTLTTAFQNFTGNITGTGSLIDIRITFRLNSGNEDICLDNFRLFGSGCGAPTNTITTGVVSTSPFAITCLVGATGTVALTSTGTFNAGNIFTAQLSDATGSFASPTSIGSLDSTSSVGIDPGGTITFAIPAGITSGALYKIRIVSSTPAVTGSESSAFQITLSGGPCSFTPPYITSVIINSCNPTCTEGHNELVFGNTGGYSVLMNTTNFDISYGSTFPLTNYTDFLTANATTTAAINTAAGCPGVFINGNGVTLPPNSSFILAPTQLCIDALVWSGLCPSGPIYMIYQNDPSWMLNGTFKNGNTGGIRYFNSTITSTTAETFSINYNYNSTVLQTGAAGDGDYVSFGPSGGAATYGDNNCILTPVLLPSSLILYEGYYVNSKSELSWQTASEQNNSHFTVSHSTNGYQFTTIGTVMGAGNSSEIIDYRFIHNYPHPGINYYKLESTDYDGKQYLKGIISVEAAFNFSYYNSINSTIELSYESDVEIYSMDGKLIQTALNCSSIPFSKSGLFFIYDKKTGVSERLFVP